MVEYVERRSLPQEEDRRKLGFFTDASDAKDDRADETAEDRFPGREEGGMTVVLRTAITRVFFLVPTTPSRRRILRTQAEGKRMTVSQYRLAFRISRGFCQTKIFSNGEIVDAK